MAYAHCVRLLCKGKQKRKTKTKQKKNKKENKKEREKKGHDLSRERVAFSNLNGFLFRHFNLCLWQNDSRVKIPVKFRYTEQFGWTSPAERANNVRELIKTLKQVHWPLQSTISTAVDAIASASDHRSIAGERKRDVSEHAMSNRGRAISD